MRIPSNVTNDRARLLWLRLVFAILLISCGFGMQALPADQDTVPDPVSSLTPDDRALRFPILDLPLNFKDGIYYPSWQQSINLTKNIHQTVNKGLANWLEPVDPLWGKVLTAGASLGFNVLHTFLPTGLGWQHQEAHRAILRANGISSENESYNKICNFCNSVHRPAPFFSRRLATFDVLDQAMVDFKADNYADFNRNRGAGHEAQMEMTLALKKDAFYYHTPLYRDLVPMWFNAFIVIRLVRESKDDDYDQKIDERNFDETTIEERDISGVEMTPWVYDLFLPDEPYDQRGTNGGAHPYYDGIDRYIGNEDLTQEMIDYLGKQQNLVLLNLISPQMFGIRKFKSKNPFNGRPLYFNFNVSHNVTSFGYIIDVNFMVQEGKYNWFFTIHNYNNQNNYWPGLGAELIRYPLNKGFISGGLDVWIQPENQRFFDNRGQGGFALKCTYDTAISKRLEWSIGADFKTEGVVFGIPKTGSSFQLSTGINLLH
ncbi:MAG: hypothetical protein R3301_14470 [Saprospiraceae bacterium]|nr:hypothetical protein [Saprospiraceae bacterium]